jgi:hypothetical protein
VVGQFFKDYGDLYNKIPESDKTNYHCIPIGSTDSGKAVYFIIPKDYSGALVGGITRKGLNALTGSAKNPGQELLDFVTGQSPASSINPALGLGGAWWQFLVQGRNPRDSFSGRDVIPQQDFEAHDMRAYMDMLKWSVGQVGGSIWFKFPDDQSKMAEGFEKVYGIPIAGRLVNTFVKASNRGESEELQLAGYKGKVEAARSSLDIKDKIAASLEKSGGKVDPVEVRRLYKEVKSAGDYSRSLSEFKSRYREMTKSYIKSPEAKQILNATTTQEREAIVDAVLKRRPNLSPEQLKIEKAKLMRRSRLLREMAP